MPIYLIEDTITPDKALVEARSAPGAVSAYNGDRLTVSAALDASQALGMARQGIRSILAVDEDPTPIEQAIAGTDPAAAFVAGFEDCDKGAEGGAA